MAYQTKQSIEAEQRRQAELAAGLMSERFPQVSNVRLEVVFRDSEGRAVQRRVRDLPGEAYAMFEVRCPLEGSTIDLKQLVSKMISGHVKRKTGEIPCSGPNEGSIEPHRMEFDIHVQYRSKAGKAKPVRTVVSGSRRG